MKKQPKVNITVLGICIGIGLMVICCALYIACSHHTKNANSVGYSDQNLISAAEQFYYDTYGQIPPIVEVDHYLDDEKRWVSLHLYEQMEDHTATWAWYEVDRTTGIGKNVLFEDVVDFTEYLNNE